MADQGEERVNGGELRTREQMHVSDRMAFLAGGDDDGDDAGAAKPAAAAVDDEDLDDEGAGTSTDDSDDDLDEDPAEVDAEADENAEDDDESDDDDKPVDEDDAEDEKADPKRLDAVRRAETRHRERMKRDRDALTAREQAMSKQHADFEAQWKPRVEAYESATKRVRRDPASVLVAAGLQEADFEAAARQIFALSEAGKKDPKVKAHADQMLREREHETELEATKRKLAEIESKIDERDKKAASTAEITAYAGRVDRLAKADPIIAHVMNADREYAQDGLVRTYQRLYTKYGTPPKPAKVVAVYAKNQIKRLEKLGVDVERISKAAPKTTTAKATAATATKGAIETRAKGGDTNGKAPSRSDIVRELEELERDRRLH